MNILVIHNHYQQRGGEDAVVEAETALLRSKGHTVHLYKAHNSDVRIGVLEQVKLFRNSLYNHASSREVARFIADHAIDVVHVHNVTPLISPSVLAGAASAGAAVVQTLHNFRLACAPAILFRDGHNCTQCIKGSPLWAVVHACYRDSRKASFAVASGVLLHRALGTYRRNVDQFIALTQFARDQFIEIGLDRSRISIKPNFLMQDPGLGPRAGGYALFAGRITQEKGVATLLRAWETHKPGLRLLIAGDGPAAGMLAPYRDSQGPICWLGHQSTEAMAKHMANAEMLVIPSEWYEGFPMVVVEAYARGLPIVASRLGSLQELVLDGVTGAHFTPGDAESLARAVSGLRSDRQTLRDCSRNARNQYTSNYTSDVNYSRLVSIYEAALESRRERRKDTGHTVRLSHPGGHQQ